MRLRPESQWGVAEGHFRAALAFVDQIGDRLGKPSVQKWYAWMLLRCDAPGDRDQARVPRRSSNRLADPTPVAR